MNRPVPARSAAAGRASEVFAAFLKLGVSAFGGPAAHFGYFHEEFVRRRQWLNEAAYADLVALSQFLPGPASSQTVIGLGLMRAGALGAAAAWVAFTLPSAILMTAFAYGAAVITGPLAEGLIHGLKLVAVAVVAQAVHGMARTLTPDARRAAIALGAVMLVTLAPASLGQVAAIVLGAGAGLILCRDPDASVSGAHEFHLSRRLGLVAFSLYLLLLIGGAVLSAITGSPTVARFDAFYRSGALVFGGGHVVLPLLKEAVVNPGWIDQNSFLAGYGAAQALPGPLFTFAAYLGAAMHGPPNGLSGAALGLAAIFLPGVLALIAALPFWAELRTRPAAQAALRGANAAVVGILAAALYNPVWTSAVLAPADFAAAVTGFVLLSALRTPPIVVVLLGTGFGLAAALLH